MAKAKKSSKTKAKKLAKLAPPYDKVTRADVITGATKGKNKKKGKEKKKIVKENVLISNFIKCISEENYAAANKYLMQVIEDKIMKRISQSIKPTLF
jgi:hypothetical protein